jgi:predicted CXXCH cytochrome family protein
MPKSVWTHRVIPAVTAVFAIAWLAACTETVYKDRPPFKDPPDQANGYLGYYDQADKQTTCGNCHVDHQGNWATHAHADAYNGLVNSGGAQSFCYGCHTVSENGNARYDHYPNMGTPDSAGGWNVKQDKAYYDVQCESCHGPGLTHVETPDASTPPLARVNADTLGDPAAPNPNGAGTCAECHSGEHHPFVEQWRESRHALAYSGSVTNTSCQPCHQGRGALKAWGVQANYMEKNDVLTVANSFGATCAVCHDPHGSPYGASLRFPIDDPTLDGNLCMKCHSRRFDPSPTSNSQGPHGPQGPALLGTAGWWPTGSDTTPQATSHGDPALNPRLCAGCHVNSFDVTDTLGGFVMTSVGHLFRPIPCIDPTTGEPLPGTANSCAYDPSERTFAACLGSGCHANETAASQAIQASASVLDVLLNQIWVDTDGDKVVDSATDGGYLAQVPTAAFNTTDNSISVAEGALYNVQLWRSGPGKVASHPDNSYGTHNPFLAQRQLAVSISALQTTYNLPAPPAPIRSVMQQGLAKAAARGAATPLRVR